MTIQSYTTKSGETQFKPVIMSRSELEGGFCLACGEPTDYAEPDARGHRCEGCGKPKVYGMEELLMMNLVVIGKDADL